MKDELSQQQLESEVVKTALEEKVRTLEQEKESLREATSSSGVEELKDELKREKEKVKNVWHMNCEQLAQYDEEISEKDALIAQLRARLAGSGVEEPEGSIVHAEEHTHTPPPALHRVARRGKAPPVDSFTEENAEFRLEDWLPTLERASSWNCWTDEELLLQFAGHLRGWALQEWNLLRAVDKQSFKAATWALQNRLDPGCRALAAQDFCHTIQRGSESVSDFIRRLEHTFQVAYGRDPMLTETRDTLLHSHLQEGLQYDLLKGPAVSGAQSYQGLCLAAKNEEKRQAELRKRIPYRKGDSGTPVKKSAGTPTTTVPGRRERDPSKVKKCFNCGGTDHLFRDCKEPKKESSGREL